MDVWHVVLFVALVVSLACFYVDHIGKLRLMESNEAMHNTKVAKMEREAKRLSEKLQDRESVIETLKETEAVNLKELDAVVKFNQELKQANEVSQLEFTRLAESSRRSVERVNGVLNPS
jgi:cbb3-type cytochrome oxidase cytochrome c subunit